MSTVATRPVVCIIDDHISLREAVEPLIRAEGLNTTRSTCAPGSRSEHSMNRDRTIARRMAPAIGGGQATSSRWRPTPTGRWRFLADASTALDASLDYEQTLASTARLAVPEVADYCIVVLVDEDGTIRWPHSAHRDPEKERLLDTWRAHLALACAAENPVARSLRTGKAQLAAVAGRRVASWWNTPHAGVLDALAPTSCVAVPLIARGLTSGALLFAVTQE